MSTDTGAPLAPPEGVRPGQAGVILSGRVGLTHISATLVDLAVRGFVRIESVPDGDDVDWLLSTLPVVDDRRGDLLPYEEKLLHGGPLAEGEFRLSELTSARVFYLNRFRRELVRDVVARGWMRRWRKDERTPEGERLFQQFRTYRHRLRRLVAAGDGLPAEVLPYALLLGLVWAPDSEHDGHDDEDPLVLFAAAWLAHCADFPGWQRLEPKRRERDSGVSHSERPWGGMPPGGDVAGTSP